MTPPATTPPATTAPGRAALDICQVTVRLGGSVILDDISVALPAACMTAFIGPNGAGKSTLLAVAAGDLRPVAGSVSIGGEPLAGLGSRALARRRAVMPQRTAVAFPFTVREVVAMGRLVHGGRGEAHVIDEVLEIAGLTEFADRTVDTLSGGEHQRVAFARVIAQVTPVTEGGVILLDEPTAAMDIAHAEVTLSLARDLTARGAAIGVVIHDLDAAAAYADRVVLLDRGRVRAVGSVADVCRPDLLSEVYGTPIEVYAHGGRLRIAPARAPQPHRFASP